ncbi:PhnD/SsuA/transferrin family substrate-binding protein [Candidatus Reidiella endopervernicosa]|uniref:PhnD/SsuA/transferrin family substrate-binding protein n=1 Tax=Candidatus Reidiella endopervernicosa TaxID=2738883 RepID=A0A6N0HYA1_9GAMM|nr:PhnD/SsuA/transferrin family substrate-binding protein [Candidatus Reidiella endopervernicosa]
MPHYMLLQRGLSERNLAHMQHLNSHRNVAHAVLAGDFDAGAIKAEVYKEFSKQNLRILAETPEYPTHTFVTRSNLSNKLVKELRTAMKSLGKSEQDVKYCVPLTPVLSPWFRQKIRTTRLCVTHSNRWTKPECLRTDEPVKNLSPISLSTGAVVTALCRNGSVAGTNTTHKESQHEP